MATDLTNIFGPEIRVYAQPRQLDTEFVGFPGADGVLRMNMGTRGRQLVISGTLAATGTDYKDARANLQAVIDSIESLQNEEEAVYTHKDISYLNIVFDRFELVPDGAGKAFFYTAEGWLLCNFICYARCLI